MFESFVLSLFNSIEHPFEAEYISETLLNKKPQRGDFGGTRLPMNEYVIVHSEVWPFSARRLPQIDDRIIIIMERTLVHIITIFVLWLARTKHKDRHAYGIRCDVELAGRTRFRPAKA